MGIQGNEVADELASRASTNPTREHISNELYPGEILSTLKKQQTKEILGKIKASSNNWTVNKHTFFGRLALRQQVNTRRMNKIEKWSQRAESLHRSMEKRCCRNTSCLQERKTVQHVLPGSRGTSHAIDRLSQPDAHGSHGYQHTRAELDIPKHKQIGIRNALIRWCWLIRSLLRIYWKPLYSSSAKTNNLSVIASGGLAFVPVRHSAPPSPVLGYVLWPLSAPVVSLVG